MVWLISFRQTFPSSQLFVFLTSTLRHSTIRSMSGKLNENIDHHDRLATTKKMRLLGLQSNQARQALALYDDYIYRQKKLPDLRMFAVAINCAMVAEDLVKGREIHQFIERNFPHLKDNLMLKQQLRYFYIKCNDQASADQLFQQSSTIQQNEKLRSADSERIDKIKIK